MMNSEDEYQAYKNDPPPGQEKHAGGRPPFYKTMEEMNGKIEQYFGCIREDNIPATITGLALHLGFTSRQALINYQEKPEFVDAIKKAKLRIEHAYEMALHGQGPTGAIFALKNFGWSDKSELDVTSGGEAMKFVLNVKPDQE